MTADHESRPIRQVDDEDGSGFYQAQCSCGWVSTTQRPFSPNVESETRAALEAQGDMKEHRA